MDGWRQEGTLVEHIIEEFQAIPEKSRGGYFPWFLKNMHLLDDKTPATYDPEKMVFEWIENAKIYLSREDQAKPIEYLTPVAKRDSFMAFAMLLHSNHPLPRTGNRRHRPVVYLWFLRLSRRARRERAWTTHINRWK